MTVHYCHHHCLVNNYCGGLFTEFLLVKWIIIKKPLRASRQKYFVRFEIIPSSKRWQRKTLKNLDDIYNVNGKTTNTVPLFQSINSSKHHRHEWLNLTSRRLFGNVIFVVILIITSNKFLPIVESLL